MQEKCPCKGSFLDKLIQPAILAVLAEGPAHGFQLLEVLQTSDMVAGNRLDPTGLYRTLKRMEEAGLLVTRWEIEGAKPPKRIFRLTGEGEGCLATWRNTLVQYRANLDAIVARIDRHPQK